MQTVSATVEANGTIDGGNVSYQATGTALVSGSIQANGAKGGAVEILGNAIYLQAATLSAAGTTLGGQINIGGDWQGHGSRQQATNTYINPFSTLDVSATAGHGGTAVVR